MATGSSDPTTLGFAVIALGLAVEEVLKALAEKNGNLPGAWLDEVEELALLRGRAHLGEAASAGQAEAATAALGAVQAIFARMRSGISDTVIE